MRALALWALLLGACTDTRGGSVPLEPGVADDFGQWVQPVIRQQCASLDCHGVAARPLRLYAMHGLRLAAELRGEDESPDELTANALSIASIDPMAMPHESLVLLKPLAENAGGFHHVGGDHFDNPDHAGYQCLIAWLRGDLPGSTTAESSCIAAAEPL